MNHCKIIPLEHQVKNLMDWLFNKKSTKEQKNKNSFALTKMIKDLPTIPDEYANMLQQIKEVLETELKDKESDSLKLALQTT